MKLTIGFSPCPNDTFIFDALVNKMIDSEGLEFEAVLADVQTLNEWAIAGKLDITKISYATLPLVSINYGLLKAGGALGKGVGPLLISRFPLPSPAVRHCTIAVPGQNTTANLLFSLAFPEASNKVFMPYDQIEDFVLSSSSDLDNIKSVKLGVIIHENRFTYRDKGLECIMDLGDYWEKETSFPIPLGGIVMKRSFDSLVQEKVNRLIRKSLDYSYKSLPTLSAFVRNNAREMDESVMMEHINLYVNSYTENLNEEGAKAVRKFLQVHSSINKLPIESESIFL